MKLLVEICLILDEGGIYKGRLNRRERIHEVNETRDTKVDLPVDYREVETVEEEEEALHGNTAVCNLLLFVWDRN
jgi:hypothetical protein